MNNKVTPGIHPEARNKMNFGYREEESIIEFFSREWYVTRLDKFSIGQSNYKYMLIKATSNYERAFGISREIVVIFSPYDTFEPRTLDAFDSVCEKLQDTRVERICYILVSKDNNIHNALKECVFEQESQIIVPISYDEFKAGGGDSHFIRNKLRENFYSKDLFDYSGPLKKDLFFFGRNQLVIDIIQKHKSNSNLGLFGLRKTGKTSIIYDVIRKLPKEDAIGIFIDCQNTSFNMKRWNKALFYVIDRIVKETGLEYQKINEKDFTEEKAAELFEEHIIKLHNMLDKTILLFFDEIENITFGKSASEHWCNGLDFVFFWQSIRSVYQNTTGVFTFSIVGTNPKCVEMVTILEKDNPIYNIFQPSYIPGFSQPQTRDMVRKLGRLMGIVFEENIHSKLTEDYGGHPFLIRRMCSKIADAYSDRPVTIDRIKYKSVKKSFNRDADYFGMLLVVLEQFYPDEYEMLTFLAYEDYTTFKFYATNDSSLVRHLIGYGLVKELDGSYDFKIDAIKEYIKEKKASNKLVYTVEEKWKETVALRNKIELELRDMVQKVLRIAYKGEVQAKEAVIRKIFKSDHKKYSTYKYSELFDSRKSNIYLKNLKVLINSNWDYFKDYFPMSQEIFINCMDILNNEGRFDAHASIPDEDEISIIRGAANKINKGIECFNES